MKTPSKSTLRKYRLTADQFHAVVAAQNGLCGLCHKPFTGTPHIDHSHSSLRVRAVTHAYCNRRRIGQHNLTSAEWLISYMRNPPAWAVLPADHTVPARKRRKRK